MKARSPASLLRRWKIMAGDGIRYNKAVRLGAWAGLVARSWMARGLCSQGWGAYPAGIAEACGAARCADSPWQMRLSEQLAENHLADASPCIELPEKPAGVVQVDKAAILKPALPGGEKGVLFISFEANMQRLLSAGAETLGRLGENYRFIIAPTWSPPHTAIGYLFPRMLPAPVFTTISNERDKQLLRRMSARYQPLPLYASSWVNPALFAPRPFAERDIDVIVLSNFAAYKRHHVLFAALAKLPAAQRPRVMLVGQPDGRRTGEVLLGEAADFGVSDCVELCQRVSDAEVCEYLCRSRTAFIGSRREGSCVAVVEAMMAGTPVGMLRGAEIGSGAFINDQTGRWLDEKNLAQDLARLVADAPSFSPREWILNNKVDCHSSTLVANDAIKAEALARGEPWTQDLWTLHWRPNPRLVDPAQSLLAQKEADRIQAEYGIHFGVFEGLA